MAEEHPTKGISIGLRDESGESFMFLRKHSSENLYGSVSTSLARMRMRMSGSRRFGLGNIGALAFYAGFGAVVGVLILHPVTQALFWLEFRSEFSVSSAGGLFEWLEHRMRSALFREMIPMNLAFGGLGAVIGAGFGGLHHALLRQREFAGACERFIGENLSQIVEDGETEHLEFKASLRWDYRLERPNRQLEGAVAKTIAGMINHEGGLLLIGVGDDGEVLGLDRDYQTLRKQDRDGFEQCVTELVASRLGVEWCGYVHARYHEVDGRDVAAIFVEASREPAYVKEGSSSRYYVRAGNATRELDAREAAAHVSHRIVSRRS